MRKYIIQISYLVLMLVLVGVIVALAKPSAGKAKAFNFTLPDLNGKQVSLSDFQGKIVVLNFWATWCAPCMREMPELEKIQQNYQNRNVQVIGIVVVSNEKEIDRQVEYTGVTYPILIGNKKTIADYGKFTSIPHTFIIDSDGKIQKQFDGSQKYDDFARELDVLLNK